MGGRRLFRARDTITAMSDTASRQAEYEKLGAFYLGRTHDLAGGETTDELVLYDAKDLTTHAVCVGMTGSGKTGLCVGLLEEAAIDNIPAIVIDPKGDIANLLLTFPDLAPEDFRPWVDEREAQRKGMTLDEYAANRASLWKKGLASWDQDGERIQRFRDACDMTVYTPGSNAARPIALLRSFDAPPAAVRDDSEVLRERVQSTVSGLLALLKVDADPIRSREHILLSTILAKAWSEGRSLDCGQLIGLVQSPGIERIGVMDLETIYPAKDRFELAMALNNLLASPGFASWMEGDPLDIDALLYSPSGKPKISILSIAHLSDEERMFFVTQLLSAVVTWMRGQSGTGSLRALLYMDEVFGFLPPTANPPSKVPMLTLLKQARAFGLGCVLATQNPVDLDYKALSNAGTWFIGRLQTERDKMRVLEGLEGANAYAGSTFDRGAMEQTLAGLGSRVFLMNNVHEDQPVIFHTRWVMSYLRGPLTRDQLKKLTAGDEPDSTAAPSPKKTSKKKTPTKSKTAKSATTTKSAENDGLLDTPPIAPAGVRAVFAPVTRSILSGDLLVYRPGVIATASLHHVRASADLDEWRDVTQVAPLDKRGKGPWESAIALREEPQLDGAPDERGVFEPLPAAASREKQYTTWSRSYGTHCYRENQIVILKSSKPKLMSNLGEDERTFRIRLRDALREERDRQIEKLRRKYTPKLAKLEDRVRRAEQKVEVEEAQYKAARTSTLTSIGTTMLGALFGRKIKSAGTASRAGSTMTRASRAAQQRGDIGRAKENVRALEADYAELERQFESSLAELNIAIDPYAVDLSEITVNPRKGDLNVRDVALAWLPYRVSGDGDVSPVFDFVAARPDQPGKA